MNTKEYLKLESVKNLNKNINRTNEIIHTLYANINSTESILKKLNAKNNKSSKMKNNFILKKKDKEYIYELGFIALFSNFEFFMYELVKDLLNQFPESYESEKLVSYEEIKDFEKAQEIKEYFVDSYAITKSKKIEDWNNFIKTIFKINIFSKYPDDLELLCVFGELRNLYLHSGAKTNSLFRKNIKKYTKITLPLNDDVPFDRKELFHLLLNLVTRSILKN